MKCKDCEAAVKDFFKCAPDKYVCIGVKEPFVIEDTNVECTEYPVAKVTVSVIKEPEPVKPYVDNNGIYIPYEYDPRYHKLLISKELFVEAYNKWIKNDFYGFTDRDDADDWSED